MVVEIFFVIVLLMIGVEYFESICDGCAIYVYGERVEDVTMYLVFCNVTWMVACLYDVLYDLVTRGILMMLIDIGNGGFTYYFFKVLYFVEEQVVDCDAIVVWAWMTYGWMGCSFDYKVVFFVMFGANVEFYVLYQENVWCWYCDAQECCLYFNHVIINLLVDCDCGIDEVCDVYVYVEKEIDNGFIVLGAKVVVIGLVLMNYNFVVYYGVVLIKMKEFVLIFVVLMGALGVKLILCLFYELVVEVMGSLFDYLFLSWLDENDSILIFDNVFVLWENVFVYGDVDKINTFFLVLGFILCFIFQGCTCFVVKLDFIVGLLFKGVEVMGLKDFCGVQVCVGEVFVYCNFFWVLIDVMAKMLDLWIDGIVFLKMDYGMTYWVFVMTVYLCIKEIIEQDFGSALIYFNLHVVDFKNFDVWLLLDCYVRGFNGYDLVECVKFMKLLWDVVGFEFGGCYELYECNYVGNYENIWFEVLLLVQVSGQVDVYKGFVELCMVEYDFDGWMVFDFVNLIDVNCYMC